jgi:WD40 repeat protein
MKTVFSMLMLTIVMFWLQASRGDMVIFGGVADDFILNRAAETLLSRRICVLRQSKVDTLWRSTSRIFAPSVSPHGKLVAFVTSSQDERKRSVSRLFILTVDGTVVATIDSVMSYSWSPNGFSVALITGYHVEDGEGFRPTGTKILDIESNRIRSLNFLTYDLQWASFDRRIYFIEHKSGRVQAIDPELPTPEETNYRGIYFSPDGRYYFRPNYEGGGLGIYRNDNTDLTDQFLRATGVVYADLAWTNTSSLLVNDPNRMRSHGSQFFLYDVALNQVVEINGLVFGSTSSIDRMGLLESGQMRNVQMKTQK